MRPVRSCLALVVLMSAVSSYAQQPKPPAPKDAAGVKGKIEAVTVYRGQALVTRLIDAGGAMGLREVVVTDLPANVVSSSLYAESAEGAEVRSVLYRERPVGEDVREEVRKLDAQIRDIQDAQLANNRNMQLLGERKHFMDSLQQFVAPTAQTELTKGVLNAETLKGLTNFQFEQRKMVADEELKLAKDARDLGEKLNVIQRQRNELTGGSARVIREAVVFANFPAANSGKIRVRYLVENATWNPSYIMRAENAKSVTLEYDASIQQMSGEDWSDVQMTLSTATPSLVAMAPVLDPLGITLAAPTPASARPDALGYAGAKSQLKQRQDEIVTQRGSAANVFNNSINGNFDRSGINNANGPGGGAGGNGQQGQQAVAQQEDRQSFDRKLNDVSKEIQVLEILARDAKDKDSRASGGPVDEGVSVTYQLASRTSLPSRQDTQLIQIASVPMKAEFFKLATPVLTSYVYDGATITNEGGMVLLAGPVASYQAGQFVGSGEIPTVAIGETFTAGFGIDSALRARRELVDKTESIQGGNKVVTFNYKLTVENFGSAPASVRVMDRLPTTKDTDMKITLTPPQKELSADPVYQQNDRKKGLLRWEIEVPAQSIGTKAVSVEYQFKLEYDKQMTVTGLAGK